MPVKRRLPKAKPAYTPLVQRLLDGDEIEYSEAVNREVLDVYYFAWAEGVPSEAIRRAGEVIHEWEAERRNADKA